MDSRKKSTFLPSQLSTNEDLSICLGYKFGVGNIIYQDFYHTGEYFLICRANNAHSDFQIYVIYFDKEQSCLQYKLLLIKIPKQEKFNHRKTLFDPALGNVVHIIQRLVKTEIQKSQEIICDIYYLNIAHCQS